MYNYSAKNNAFYPDSERSTYEFHSVWPDDCIPVPDSIYDEFAAAEPPAGKVRTASADGLPYWDDIPEATKEELIAVADAEKSTYLALANERIAPLVDAVEFDMATIEEVERLKAWKKYRILLIRVDVNTVPNIEWPIQPDA
ncbi:tail fiber assembly protein [Limnobaculum xujianqingii]|uniref:tail fiber assembly protein n=1 Tax=Limnobaculum xujianqingii TaxID=2738837 RepID=UPI00112E64B8|nr:tail fiber assembly protein [Limnobaculum xujianqingii]